MKCWNFRELKNERAYFYRDQSLWLPFYILTDHSNGSTVHTHEFIEIPIIRQGTLQHRRFQAGEDALEQQLSAGDILGFLPGERHEFNGENNDAVLDNLDFSPEIFGSAWHELLKLPGLDALFNRRQTLHASPAELEQITHLVLRIQQEFFHQQPGYELNLPGLLTDLLIKIGRLPLRQENVISNVHINAAVQYIRKHYAQKITLDNIARASGVGRTYLCRLFQENMAMSVWDFVNRTRIEQAKFHIQTTHNIAVYEIAAACGFEDSSYFARLFRKIEGVSPRGYIQQIHRSNH